MYFQSFEINNYGSINSVRYSFRFNGKGNPVPLVLIGQNGSGKTLVLSNLVDALIEFKRQVFHNNLLEVNESNYFKIGSKNYIRKGTNTSRVVIKATHEKQELKYIDIMSLDTLKIKEDAFVLAGDIKETDSFNENGFYKKTEGKIKGKDYSEFINLYFPADRFYLPLWYNNENYKRINYEKQFRTGKPETNMIKSDILSNIKNWLVNIYLQSSYRIVSLGDSPSLPEELRGKTISVQDETHIQQLISNVFRVILGNNSFSHDPINRKAPMVSLNASSLFCRDIDQLSEGQMGLFAIALSIIKEWDIDHGDFSLEDIIGTVIIDEADLGLHIDFAHDAFPRMMQLFPNVQFIITTHSPFMISGMLESYGDDIDIIEMPDGIKIVDVELFAEMRRAREVFNAGIEKHKKEIVELEKELSHLRTLNNQVLVYTEGETDAILLKKAMKELGETDLEVSFQPATSINGNKNESAIKKLLLAIQSNPSISNSVVIGMFDRDVKETVIDSTGRKAELNQIDFVKMGNHLYAFAIPVPHDRPEEDQVSIEHFFTDEEIKTPNEEGKRLFIGKEFRKNGNHIDDTLDYNYINARKYYGTIKIIEHEQEAYVTDRKGNGDYSLSKRRFAEAVRDDRPNFNDFDFSEFNKIFDIIKKIIEDAHLAAEEA